MAKTGEGAGRTETAEEPKEQAEARPAPILRLSTRLDACDQVDVDGENYDILGFKHLSDDDEAEVMATLARYDNLSVVLVTTKDDREAVAVAKKMRRKRLDLLTRLTTIPEPVATKLPPTEQMKLLRKVQEVAGLATDDESDGEGAG